MAQYKVCCLGEGGVGKTALTVQFCSGHFVEKYDPTIEDSYRKQMVVDGHSCLLEILDTAGQEEFTSLRDQWIYACGGFLLIYSITNTISFSNIQMFYDQICRVKDTNDLPIMLIGNKCDLEEKREVSMEEGIKLSQKLHCEFKESSAKTRVNVEDAFTDLLREILKRNPNASELTSGHKKKFSCTLL